MRLIEELPQQGRWSRVFLGEETGVFVYKVPLYTPTKLTEEFDREHPPSQKQWGGNGRAHYCRSERSRERIRDAHQRRISREKELILRFRHPNIVACSALGALWEIFMEYIPGGSLETKTDDYDIARKGVRVNGDYVDYAHQVLRTVRDIADALDYLHRRGIVHADVRPSNIIVTNGGGVLIDLGSAFVRGESLDRIVERIKASPEFEAPEIERIDRSYDRRRLRALLSGELDIYSLGATLHECLTLREWEYDGNPSITQTPVEQLANAEGIGELLKQMLHKNPDDRINAKKAHDKLNELLSSTTARAPKNRRGTVIYTGANL